MDEALLLSLRPGFIQVTSRLLEIQTVSTVYAVHTPKFARMQRAPGSVRCTGSNSALKRSERLRPLLLA